MFPLITNMVMLRETHNRRKDFDQGSNRQKIDLEKKKKTSSHCLICWQTKLLGRATVPKLYFFLCNLCSCGVPGQYVAFFDEVEEESGTLKTTGFVMPRRQYHSGQDQGGSS